MELGFTSFAETHPDPMSGEAMSHGERLRNVIAEVEKAEEVGLDVYGLGEHHRIDMAGSAPAITLAAAAARTERIRLSSAVIVLSSADPVRTYQDFATLDLISSGRAELMVGRGSFIESFPLFGYSLDDYDDLFTEKLELLIQVRDHERVRQSLVEGGHDPEQIPLAVHGLGYIADGNEEAAEEIYPSFAATMTRIGRERGWPPLTRDQFDWMRSPEGSLVVGTPETVATKILLWKEILGISRFMLHHAGTVPHDKSLRSIEYLGTKVGPIVNAA